MRTSVSRLLGKSLRLLSPELEVCDTHSRRLSSKNQDVGIGRAFQVLKDDMKKLFEEGIRYSKSEYAPSHCDVLVIGGGVMGCSTAFWLKHRALEGLNVVVVERDPTVIVNNCFDPEKYQENTSVLSVGGLRQQFSLQENIELSLKSAEFFRNIDDYLSVKGQDPVDIQFHPGGYLFLASENGAQILEENHKLQKSLGARVELMSAEQLKERFPWLNTDGIVCGSHGLENEGWFDPYSLLFAFRRKALHLGAYFLRGDVTRFETEHLHDMIKEGSQQEAPQFHSATIKLPDGTDHKITFGILVIAAGGYSGKVAELLDIGCGPGTLPSPLPVECRKRYVFNVHCPEGPGILSPLVVDTTGAYFRREGLNGHYLCGMSPPEDEEPDSSNLDVDYAFFEEKVWPIIAHRVPAFEKAKLKSAWAGYYDFNRFDENAFVGPHPAYMNVYLATGFSGHGIQQSPMVGKAIMELIIDSQYKTVNLERLHYQRYLDNQPLWETNIV